MRAAAAGRHLLLDKPLRSYGPVHILQGMLDPDVPYQHALMLVEHFAEDPVVLTLVKDGDPESAVRSMTGVIR